MQDTEQAEYFSKLPLPTETAVKSGLDPNAPSWGSGIAFGYWLLSVFLIAIIPLVSVIVLAISRDPNLVPGEALVEFAKNDASAIVVQILAVFPAHLLTLLLGWVIVTRLRRDSFTEALGWKSGGIRWWHYPVIIVGFFALAAVASTVYPEQENDMIRMIQSSQAALILVTILATFTAPIVEELVYRGVLYSSFQRTFGVPTAMGLVTFLFALVHIPQYWPSFSTIALILILSFILTGLRIYSKNLWPCIVLHTIFNGLQSVGLIAAAYVEKTEPAAQAAALVHLVK